MDGVDRWVSDEYQLVYGEAVGGAGIERSSVEQ